MLRDALPGDEIRYRSFLEAITPPLRRLVSVRAGGMGRRNARYPAGHAACHPSQAPYLGAWMSRYGPGCSPLRATRSWMRSGHAGDGSRSISPNFARDAARPGTGGPHRGRDIARVIAHLDSRSAQIVRAIGLERGRLSPNRRTSGAERGRRARRFASVPLETRLPAQEYAGMKTDHLIAMLARERYAGNRRCARELLRAGAIVWAWRLSVCADLTAARITAARAGSASVGEGRDAADVARRRRIGRIRAAASEGRARRAALIAAPLVLGLAVILELVALPAGRWGVALIGDNALKCIVSIPLLALAPFIALMRAAREGAPTRPGLAGAVIGLAAAGGGAALYCVVLSR